MQTLNPQRDKLSYKSFTEINDETLINLHSLEKKIFEKPLSIDDLKNELSVHKKIFGIIVYDKETPIAFKIGYAKSVNTFHSWIGGVLPDYRSRGIASDLISKQEDWCKINGFKKIRTHSSSSFKNMMILNLKSGFDIIGTMSTTSKELNIVFEKKISK